MVVMQPAVWISIWFTLIGKSQADSVTACFRTSPPCNSFNITCGENKKIRITGAEYRYSNSSGMNNSSCCKLDTNDCEANYSYKHEVILYNRCSGKMSCLNNLVPQPTDHACKNYTGDKYAHVTYDCIHDNTIIDMCQADANQTSEVNIMLKTGNVTSDPIKCSCYVTAQNNVTYQLVDVRLFTNVSDTEGTYDCVTSTFNISNESIQCKNSSDQSLVYMNFSNMEGVIGDLENSKEVLQLTYTEKGRPDMVWIHLKGFNVLPRRSWDANEYHKEKKEREEEQLHPEEQQYEKQAPTRNTVQPKNDKFQIQCKIVPSTATIEAISTERDKTSTVGVAISSYGTANTFSTRRSISSTRSTELSAMMTTLPEKSPVGETHKGKTMDEDSLPIIVGVVIAAIIVITVVSSALIILKRRHRKSKEDESPKSDSPDSLSNRSFKCIDESGKSCAAVETSNYESINDELVVTYSSPVKKTKDNRGIHEDTMKHGGDVSADDYDRIQFEKKFANKVPNYDCLPAMGGEIRDDTYSRVSNQPEFVHTARGTANEYSHCKPSSKETKKNDEDYSQFDLKGVWKKNKQPNTIEEDSYNHIDFENTKTSLRNGKAVSGEHEFELEKGTLTLPDGNYGVPSNLPCQGIMGVSLRDNYIHFKQNGIYATPRSKDQQNTAVLNVQKEKESHGIDNGSHEKFGLEDNNHTAQDTHNTSDYELAKPI